MTDLLWAGPLEDLSWITDSFKRVGHWFSETALWIYSPVQWMIDWWPLLGHFALFALVILVLGFIARFLPDTVKLWLLVLIGFIGAFIAGEVNQYRQRLAAERARLAAEKKRPKPKPPPRPAGTDWFGR